jgi:hypothetical protein
MRFFVDSPAGDSQGGAGAAGRESGFSFTGSAPTVSLPIRQSGRPGRQICLSKWQALLVRRMQAAGPRPFRKRAPFNQEESVKSRMSLLILLASSAAACAPSAPAAAPAPRAAAVDADSPPPVLALLSERDRLSLTSAQVAALDSIARAWDVQNHKLARQMGALRTRGGLRLGLALTRPRAALAAVAENNRRAAYAVEQVLNQHQRQRLCQLQRAREGKVALRADKRGSGQAYADSRAMGRSLATSRSRRGEARRSWPWCSPASASSYASSQSDR